MVFSIQTKKKPEEDILEDGISMLEEASLSTESTSEKEIDLKSKEEWAKGVIEEIEKETRSH